MTANKSAIDRQEGGQHYKDMAIQPAEYIFKNGIGFLEGNSIKYTSRWRKKGGIQDLRKAIHSLELLIEMEEAAAANLAPTTPAKPDTLASIRVPSNYTEIPNTPFPVDFFKSASPADNWPWKSPFTLGANAGI